MATVYLNTRTCAMQIPEVRDSVHLAVDRVTPPLPAGNEKTTAGGYDESGYHRCYGQSSSAASDAVTGYESLDSPPHYDFYANTEVWGRRRRFRPSLYQLYTTPEVCLQNVCVIFIRAPFNDDEVTLSETKENLKHFDKVIYMAIFKY